MTHHCPKPYRIVLPTSLIELWHFTACAFSLYCPRRDLTYVPQFSDWPCDCPCGLWGCKNRRAPFPGRMLYKATKPGLFLFYILACFNCIVAYRGPFLCIVNFSYVFCRLVVLVKLSLLAKWLARKIPLRKPNRGEGSSPWSPGQRELMIVLVYCILSFIVLLHYVCVLPRPCVIHFLLLWHDIAYLCWKCRKAPTN